MNLTIIQKSIDCIEEILKTDITAKELSEMAGLSMFHQLDSEACRELGALSLIKTHIYQ